jgi:hypothetical protein
LIASGTDAKDGDLILFFPPHAASAQGNSKENVMRHFILALLLACAASGASQAADRQPDSATLQDFAGQYVLHDGRVLSVTLRQRTLAAQVEGRAMALLKATGPATFSTVGGDLVLTFDQRSNGSVAAVAVTETGQAARQASR